MKYLLARSGVLVPASLATWRCQANAPAVITASKVLDANGQPWQRNRKGRGGIVRPRDGILSLMSNPVNRMQGPPAASGSGAVSAITSVNRVAGSQAGGLSVVLTVTGLTGLPTFTFGGVPGTTTGTSGSTQATVTVPASVATGKVDIVCAGQTLPNGFEYMPSTGSTIAAWTDSATISPYTADTDANGTTTISTDWAYSGTRSIRCQRTQTGSGLDGVTQFVSPQFTANTATHPNGVFIRQYILIPSATIASLGDQIKLSLARSNLGGSNGDGYMFGVGSSFSAGGSSTGLVIYSDFDTGGTIHANGNQGFGDGVWVEAIQWLSWDGSAGHGRCWTGTGGSLNEITAAAITNASFLKGATDLIMQGGMPYVRSNTATQNVYNDNVWIGPYFPDPQTVS